MKNKEYLWEICMEIYRKMFSEATPKANFDVLISTGEAKKEGFFMNYYLRKEKQEEIINAICKKHKLAKHEKEKVINEIYLGCSPRW